VRPNNVINGLQDFTPSWGPEQPQSNFLVEDIDSLHLVRLVHWVIV